MLQPSSTCTPSCITICTNADNRLSFSQPTPSPTSIVTPPNIQPTPSIITPSKVQPTPSNVSSEFCTTNFELTKKISNDNTCGDGIGGKKTACPDGQICSMVMGVGTCKPFTSAFLSKGHSPDFTCNYNARFLKIQTGGNNTKTKLFGSKSSIHKNCKCRCHFVTH